MQEILSTLILLTLLHSLHVVTNTQRDVAHVTLRFTQQEFVLHAYPLKVSGFSFLCFKTCDSWVEFKYSMHLISLTHGFWILFNFGVSIPVTSLKSINALVAELEGDTNKVNKGVVTKDLRVASRALFFS